MTYRLLCSGHKKAFELFEFTPYPNSSSESVSVSKTIQRSTYESNGVVDNKTREQEGEESVGKGQGQEGQGRLKKIEGPDAPPSLTWLERSPIVPGVVYGSSETEHAVYSFVIEDKGVKVGSKRETRCSWPVHCESHFLPMYHPLYWPRSGWEI